MSPKVIRATPRACLMTMEARVIVSASPCLPLTSGWVPEKRQKQAPVRPTGKRGFGTSALTGLSAIFALLRCTAYAAPFDRQAPCGGPVGDRCPAMKSDGTRRRAGSRNCPHLGGATGARRRRPSAGVVRRAGRAPAGRGGGGNRPGLERRNCAATGQRPGNGLAGLHHLPGGRGVRGRRFVPDHHLVHIRPHRDSGWRDVAAAPGAAAGRCGHRGRAQRVLHPRCRLLRRPDVLRGRRVLPEPIRVDASATAKG